MCNYYIINQNNILQLSEFFESILYSPSINALSISIVAVIYVLVDHITLLIVKLRRVCSWQLSVEVILYCNQNSCSCLLTLPPIQNQLLLLEGCKQFPDYFLYLSFIFVGQFGFRLCEDIQQGKLFLGKLL